MEAPESGNDVNSKKDPSCTVQRNATGCLLTGVLAVVFGTLTLVLVWLTLALGVRLLPDRFRVDSLWDVTWLSFAVAVAEVMLWLAVRRLNREISRRLGSRAWIVGEMLGVAVTFIAAAIVLVPYYGSWLPGTAVATFLALIVNGLVFASTAPWRQDDEDVSHQRDSEASPRS